MQASTLTQDLPLMTAVPMEYYQAVVINALVNILHDQTLNSHHHTVVEAIMSIFKTQGLKCASFLPQVWFRIVVESARHSLYGH